MKISILFYYKFSVSNCLIYLFVLELCFRNVLDCSDGLTSHCQDHTIRVMVKISQCQPNVPKSSTRVLSELRWELFRANNLESEMLPPTVGTLIPHVHRVNYMAMRYRCYTSLHPSLPNLEGDGWSEKGPQSSVSHHLHPVLL